MTVFEQQMKCEVERALLQLPTHKMAEVLDFILFLKKRCTDERSAVDMDLGTSSLPLHTLPASHLDQMTALVEWGGDAIADAETLYDDER